MEEKVANYKEAWQGLGRQPEPRVRVMLMCICGCVCVWGGVCGSRRGKTNTSVASVDWD